jgi:hypothetical protein
VANDNSEILIRRGLDSARRLASVADGEPHMTTDSGPLGGGLYVGGHPSGFGNACPPVASSRWIRNPSGLIADATAAVAANIIYYAPICIPSGYNVNVKNIGCHVRGAAAGNVRVGLYSDEDGEPGTKILDSGSLSTSTAAFKQMGVSQIIPVRSGWHWTAFLCSSASPTFEVLSTTGYLPLVAWAASATKRPTIQYQIFAYAALPATATSVGVSTGAFPIVSVQMV